MKIYCLSVSGFTLKVGVSSLDPRSLFLVEQEDDTLNTKV